MKKEIAEAWVKDLRSSPPQAAGVLHNGVGYCCLGRLAVVLGCTFRLIDGNFYPTLKDQYVECRSGTLPKQLMGMAGMKWNDGFLPQSVRSYASLVGLNDLGGASFAEIADVIEKYWQDL